ncbi:ComF family protein [Patescibacteria group bacterium]|nr:ComF family protein [Patescibacteria group bacterium]
MAAWYIEAPRKTGLKLADFVWPAHCVGCGCPETWWCLGCDLSVITIDSPTCPRCNRPSLHGTYCATCRKGKMLRGVLAGAQFNGPLPALVKALKYRHARAVAPHLVPYLERPLNTLPHIENAVLVPIPLHASRERQRGHNQSRILAGLLSKQTKIPLADGLERIKPTISQTGLNRSARQKNVEGVFRWRKRVKPRATAILVDDVFTTGATLESAARTCRAAGVQTVWGLAVAKR